MKFEVLANGLLCDQSEFGSHIQKLFALLLGISKIQLVVFYQCSVLIG